MSPVARFDSISKSFGQVKVLSQVSFSIFEGEVVALMGENGAGKSTLMKILSGIYPVGDYAGQVLINEKVAAFRTPLEAEAAGVSIIHQELSFFSHLSVAENIFVGHWPRRHGRVDWGQVYNEAKKWLEYVGASCSPYDLMQDLSVGNQQLVEIAKALSRKSKILVLDEPTSALSPKEVKNLFALIGQLRSQGCALVYISHKMDEIFTISDRIVVLRDGHIVGDQKTADWRQEELIKSMVGRELAGLFPIKRATVSDEIVLKAQNVSIKKRGQPYMGPFSFNLKRGEIFGIGGLLGSGRTELLKALYGTEDYELVGEVVVNSKRWSSRSPQNALSGQVVYLSEDRKRESVLKKRSIHENLRISDSSLRGLFSIVRETKESVQTSERLKSLRVRYQAVEQDILSLSGGNQQKVVLGRILEVAPNIIMLDEPTRGVDVGAKFEIYQILFELAEAGKSLVVVSSELPELIGLCDRVLVLRQGRDMGILDSHELTPESVMSRAFGLQEVAT